MGIFNRKKEELKTEEESAKEDRKNIVSDKSSKKVSKTSEIKTFDVAGVLIAPLVTEKSSAMEQLSKYTFIVEPSANKTEIIKAFITRYGVVPEKVNISNYYGKYKRYGRNWGKTKDWKKAIVFLPKGKSINVYEGVK